MLRYSQETEFIYISSYDIPSICYFLYFKTMYKWSHVMDVRKTKLEHEANPDAYSILPMRENICGPGREVKNEKNLRPCYKEGSKYVLQVSCKCLARSDGILTFASHNAEGTHYTLRKFRFYRVLCKHIYLVNNILIWVLCK